MSIVSSTGQKVKPGERNAVSRAGKHVLSESLPCKTASRSHAKSTSRGFDQHPRAKQDGGPAAEMMGVKLRWIDIKLSVRGFGLPECC